MAIELGAEFVSLLEVGNINYFTWKKQWEARVEIMKAASPTDFLKDVRTDIEKCREDLQKWKNYIFEIRQKNPLSNHYTLKQCLVLSNYLFNLSKNRSTVFKHRAFTLLHCISETVSESKIQNSLLAIHVNQKSPIIDSNDGESNFTRYNRNEIHQFLDKLKDDFIIDEKVALASLIAIPDISQENDVLNWCKDMEEFEDSEEILSFSEEARQNLEQFTRFVKSY